MSTKSEYLSKQIPATAAEEKEEVTTSLDSAVGAAIIASGIGSLVLGLGVVLNEINPAVNSFLKWVGPVGPLSGKVGLTVIAFIASWVGLHYAFRNRTVKLMTSFWIALVLIVLGMLLTYPPVFEFIKGVFVPAT
jgi:hypothetical protein